MTSTSGFDNYYTQPQAEQQGQPHIPTTSLDPLAWHPVARIIYFLQDYLVQHYGRSLSHSSRPDYSCSVGFTVEDLALFITQKFSVPIEKDDIESFLQPKFKKYKTKKRLKEHVDQLNILGIYPLEMQMQAYNTFSNMPSSQLLYISSTSPPPAQKREGWLAELLQRTRRLLWNVDLPPEVHHRIFSVSGSYLNKYKATAVSTGTLQSVSQPDLLTSQSSFLKDFDNILHYPVAETPNVQPRPVGDSKGKQRNLKIPQSEYVLKPCKCPETEDFVLNYMKLLETGVWGGKYDKERPPARIKLCRRGGGRPTWFQRIVQREGTSKSNLKRKRRAMREGVGGYMGEDPLEFVKAAPEEFTEVSRQTFSSAPKHPEVMSKFVPKALVEISSQKVSAGKSKRKRTVRKKKEDKKEEEGEPVQWPRTA
uniref:Uncharacterized protein n=1 Tax=Aplanochytrium stocchinoi TaxID=215587 RepID=A0A7S3LM01_9STRA|mmetsp:Transcript_30979/g.38256  ORF Transcript_30979/g.38256 Transcript_30979/m.38256 type:complete len:423 (-) Transcript_30979:133-1401(-)|eukprot:CAMPEP_0204840844 /NCGR_PEP_ID=MMETSP1346-20131115/39235_1 /ASSEMBLY_ACC=CAM_ASM_000771 /TAXON_ID=215587 /ORGANISM="Aplanochytrium stocchinoi, Strain GSBS06" /LENGTH=422 /DNA_ID=CAMNT_0051978499 /DNA_START=585 /DNA_END=1853 /DNA_ORIENTATION=-